MLIIVLMRNIHENRWTFAFVRERKKKPVMRRSSNAVVSIFFYVFLFVYETSFYYVFCTPWPGCIIWGLNICVSDAFFVAFFICFRIVSGWSASLRVRFHYNDAVIFFFVRQITHNEYTIHPFKLNQVFKLGTIIHRIGPCHMLTRIATHFHMKTNSFKIQKCICC